jgi:RHS repeat-associated protein
VYDVLGNRIEKIVDADGDGSGSPVTTKFAYDGNGNAYVDFTGSSTIVARHIFGDGADALIANIVSGSTKWYLQDILGSTRDLTNSAGALIDHLDYNSFGKLTYESANGSDRYLWTAREYDAEIDLQYNRARYYDANTGRWISQDPLGFDAGDSNLYRYVKNGPMGATDPNGLDELRASVAPDGLVNAQKKMGKEYEVKRDYVFSIVEDGITLSAQLWKGGVRINSVEDMINFIQKDINNCARAATNYKAHEYDWPELRIHSITITGHGGPGKWLGPRDDMGNRKTPRLQLSDLVADKKTGKFSAHAEALKKLRPLWTSDNKGITLNMCETAAEKEGKDFLAEMSSLAGANVKGWDDEFEGRACGKEWTATSNKNVTQTGDTKRKADIMDKYIRNRSTLNLMQNSTNPYYVIPFAWDVVGRIRGVR